MTKLAAVMTKLEAITDLIIRHPARSIVGASCVIGLATLLTDYNNSASYSADALRADNLAHKEKLPGLHKKAHATALQVRAEGADPKLCDTLRVTEFNLQSTLSLMETNAARLDLKGDFSGVEKSSFGHYIAAFRRPDPDVVAALKMCQ